MQIEKETLLKNEAGLFIDSQKKLKRPGQIKEQDDELK